MAEKSVEAVLRTHRFPELDSARGLAALTVVFAHFSAIWGNTPALERWESSPAHVLTAGHEAVVFFFVLSGFVLSVPYTGPRPPGYGAYLVKRFCRIYIPYASAVLLAAAGARLCYDTRPTGSPWSMLTWTQKPTLSMLGSILLVRSAYEQQINTALWSVIYEIRISLIFPLLYFALRTMRTWTALLVVFLACTVLSVCSVPGLANVFVAALFCIGILLFRNLRQVHALLDRRPTWQTGLLGLLSFVAFEWTAPLSIRLLPLQTHAMQGFIDLMVAVWAAGLIVYVTRPGRVRRVLTHRFMLHLGALSYSTYLIHATVLFALLRTRTHRVSFGWYLLPYLLLTYVVSEVFYRWIDQRSVLLGRKASSWVSTHLSALPFFRRSSEDVRPADASSR